MSLVWDLYPGKEGELLLALALANWANDDGDGIFASIKTMAGKTRQSPRAVAYQLRAMQRAGWLEVVEKRHRKSTIYRIPVERHAQPAVGSMKKLQSTASRGVAKCSPSLQPTTGLTAPVAAHTSVSVTSSVVQPPVDKSKAQPLKSLAVKEFHDEIARRAERRKAREESTS